MQSSLSNVFSNVGLAIANESLWMLQSVELKGHASHLSKMFVFLCPDDDFYEICSKFVPS